MLSAGTAASVGINAKILLVNLHIQILLDIRHNIQGHKRGLALALGVERGDPHQTMHALLRLQVAVSINAVDLESHGLDARLVPVQIVQHFQGKSFSFRPPGVHTVQHAAPVAAFRAARSGIQLQNGIVLVILSRQQYADSQPVQFPGKFIQFTSDLRDQGSIFLLVAHLDQGKDIVILGLQLAEILHGILHVFQFFHQFVGAVGIIPETRGFHLHLQFFNPLCLISKVKVNPSLPLMEFRKPEVLTS